MTKTLIKHVLTPIVILALYHFSFNSKESDSIVLKSAAGGRISLGFDDEGRPAIRLLSPNLSEVIVGMSGDIKFNGLSIMSGSSIATIGCTPEGAAVVLRNKPSVQDEGPFTTVTLSVDDRLAKISAAVDYPYEQPSALDSGNEFLALVDEEAVRLSLLRGDISSILLNCVDSGAEKVTSFYGPPTSSSLLNVSDRGALLRQTRHASGDAFWGVADGPIDTYWPDSGSGVPRGSSWVVFDKLSEK